VKAFSEAKVDMKALEVTERGEGDVGEAHIIVNDIDKAREVLTGISVEHSIDDVLVVEMDDRVGGLVGVLEVLREASINIHFIYAFVTRVAGKSLSVFAVDDPQEVEKLLRDKSFVVVTESTIKDGGTVQVPGQTALDYYLGGEYFW
jgi:hypothetical protein